MDILRARGGGESLPRGLSIPQQLQALCDGGVGGVELRGTGVGVNRVRNLVVAALIRTVEVEPDLRNVRVDADGAGVCVERVAVLVDLEVQNTNRSLEYRVAAIRLHYLLVGVVRLVVLLAGRIGTAEKVPALSDIGV